MGLPPENLLTTSAELISWLQIHGRSWWINGLAASLELYCLKRVKVTHGSLGFTYNIRKILNKGSYVQEITDTKKGSGEPRIVLEGQHYGTLSVTHKPYRIVELAHIKDHSQATPRRKRFHNEVMHDLRYPRIQLANKYPIIYGVYIVNNQPRGVGVWVWIVAAIVHGANAC